MTVRYLLDTNICIYIAKHNPPTVRARFETLAANELAMSTITYGELRYGAEKSQARAKALRVVNQLTSVIQIAKLDAAAAEQYGLIRASLSRQGRIIGNNDLWIAAHAKAMGWTVVTNNVREFERIEDLKVENWV
ncbi:MAG: type II toxin-antitoxin system VapC family toxin [Alcaligenaceae bacterium]|nr:type II toxin-antitoxin system VapC family toxin [Alcaligenaceae bacterium]